jgi:hypothetical protein
MDIKDKQMFKISGGAECVCAEAGLGGRALAIRASHLSGSSSVQVQSQ